MFDVVCDGEVVVVIFGFVGCDDFGLGSLGKCVGVGGDLCEGD